MLFKFKTSLRWDKSVERYSIDLNNFLVKVHPLTGQLCIENHGLLLPASWLELAEPELNELPELQTLCDETFKRPILFLDLDLGYNNSALPIFLYAGENLEAILEDGYNAAFRMLFFTFLMKASEEYMVPVYICTQKYDEFELFLEGRKIFGTIKLENIISKFNELSMREGVF